MSSDSTFFVWAALILLAFWARRIEARIDALEARVAELEPKTDLSVRQP